MKLLTFKEVQALLGGRSRTTIYRDIETKRIPQPFKLSGRQYWRDDEMYDFIASKFQASEQ